MYVDRQNYFYRKSIVPVVDYSFANNLMKYKMLKDKHTWKVHVLYIHPQWDYKKSLLQF